MIEVFENVYGHKNRVTWFKNFLDKKKKGLEFGCGTGIMISSQLLQEGYNIYGIDLDEPSIRYGQNAFKENGLDPERLINKDLAELPDHSFDYILASEVFEHIFKKDIDGVMALIQRKLKPDGQLIVTVPNGFGWFEFEALFWQKLGIGTLFDKLFINKLIYGVKDKVLGVNYNKYTSTVANSPHVRRFTMNSISELVNRYGFSIKERRGSVLFAGGFTSLIFSGFTPFIKFNIWLGKLFPSISSGFYLYAVKEQNTEQIKKEVLAAETNI